MKARILQRNDIHGWVVLDKPAGMTSTHAVSQLKRLFNAKKAGHAGTLDPLATGVLPVAFGEATKTVPFVQAGDKVYRFTVRWGIETDTNDSDGKVAAQSEARPAAAEIAALLPRFTGTIQQLPPSFSAIKVNGERAYDLARGGVAPALLPRTVTIHALDLIEAESEEAVFEARCGKGTYVRALARDLGRSLGCYGHVTALRRTRAGPFYEQDLVSLQLLKADDSRFQAIRPVEAGLAELARVAVDSSVAAKLRCGQTVLLRGRDAPLNGAVYVAYGGVVIAIGAIEKGVLVPSRIFNLPS
ncbi:MAG: tRNA pseudouridine(55) synthase TruB [Beijerinckiaceae bacterium]|nr:tRNA pseudouridine(55) synthase TruB [Beijerinckiaceae bacterium]